MRDPQQLTDAFEDHSLPKAEWTHEAHLTVCWTTVRRLGIAGALTHLRTGIAEYNAATDTPNTDTGGYHDTITRYYVEAVGSLAEASLEAVLEHPSCSRTAPLDHWSRTTLFSVEARRGWVEPDLRPLPW